MTDERMAAMVDQLIEAARSLEAAVQQSESFAERARLIDDLRAARKAILAEPEPRAISEPEDAGAGVLNGN